MQIYKFLHMDAEYCNTLFAGYKEFGISFMSPYLHSIMLSDFLLSRTNIKRSHNNNIKCLAENPIEFIKKIDTAEAKFILGSLYLLDDNKDNTTKAIKIFHNLYKNSSNEMIKYNSGFCLGLYYYNKDKKKALNLIEESISNGYIPTILEQMPEMSFPENKVILNYSLNFCYKLKDNIDNEYGEN